MTEGLERHLAINAAFGKYEMPIEFAFSTLQNLPITTGDTRSLQGAKRWAHSVHEEGESE